ncbi:uncharacterized protein LOC121051066 [Rosa chinensis]|uniref:uncharacterized protein LOC121051066 n=1 Tax=Rosa chinensis TaxID=74649 RepID=UPI001AD8C226|nr:uncharacterized protein LOC121051066 [Rosa chinensis]
MDSIATPEYEVPIKDTNRMESKLELIVKNLRREDLKITLWGNTTRKLNLQSIEASGSAILIVITSLRVTKFQQQIQASTTNHSCILINQQIHQTQEYQAEFSKTGDKVKTVPGPGKRLKPKQLKKKHNEDSVRTECIGSRFIYDMKKHFLFLLISSTIQILIYALYCAMILSIVPLLSVDFQCTMGGGTNLAPPIINS